MGETPDEATNTAYAARRQHKDYRRLGALLEGEHPCQNNTCDIAVAIEQALYLWAAHLLVGATETSSDFDAHYDRFRNPQLAAFEEIERLLLLEVPHVKCRYCGDLMFSSEGFLQGVACGNCQRFNKSKRKIIQRAAR